MSDADDREFAVDLWVDSQADLLRPTGCEDPDAVARALWLSDLQVVPLADPAPVGLTEALRPWLRHRSTACARNNHADPCSCGLDDALARLSAAPVDDRERVPEGWRVEWGEWDGDPIAGSGFTPRLVPLPVQGDEQ